MRVVHWRYLNEEGNPIPPKYDDWKEKKVVDKIVAYYNETIIAIYDDITSAEQDSSISNLHMCLSGRVNTSGLYDISRKIFIKNIFSAKAKLPDNLYRVSWGFLGENDTIIKPMRRKPSDSDSRSKKIGAFYNNQLIETFESVSIASYNTTFDISSITKSADGLLKYAGGYDFLENKFINLGTSRRMPDNCISVYWRYLDDNDNIINPEHNDWLKEPAKRAVIAYYDNVIIGSYLSVKDAERATGVANQTISKCLTGNKEIAGVYDKITQQFEVKRYLGKQNLPPNLVRVKWMPSSSQLPL